MLPGCAEACCDDPIVRRGVELELERAIVDASALEYGLPQAMRDAIRGCPAQGPAAQVKVRRQQTKAWWCAGRSSTRLAACMRLLPPSTFEKPAITRVRCSCNTWQLACCGAHAQSTALLALLALCCLQSFLLQLVLDVMDDSLRVWVSNKLSKKSCKELMR